MSPLLAPFTRPSSTSREDTNHLTRIKHAFSVLTSTSRKQDRPILQSQHEKSFDDLHHHHHHYSAHSTLHTCMSNFKTKIRRINSGGSSNDTKGIFNFRPLDGRRRFLRSPADNDRYILSNAQTIANDSTDQKNLIRMFISDSSPRGSISSSRRRRSSFGSATSNNSRNLLSIGPTSRFRRRYSMSGSELTVASEDLTAREFAEHCGISVYPEEEDDDREPFASGISILVQQNRISNAPPQSTVMSSTRSTKSKISIMEDTFWTPLVHDFDEPLSKLSSDITEACTATRSEGFLRERRNSLITFAETPNLAKHKLQGQGPLSKQGIRSGRHSAPIPIPNKPIFTQQSSALQHCTSSPSQIDSLSNSSHSTDSSLALSYSSFTTSSTASSVSFCAPSAIPIFPRTPSSPNPEKTCSSFEAPIFAAIMSERQPTDPSTELVPIIVKKGRFEVTIGNSPAPDPPSPTLDGVITPPSPTDEKFVVFQRRKYRPESPSSDGEGARRSLDESQRGYSS